MELLILGLCFFTLVAVTVVILRKSAKLITIVVVGFMAFAAVYYLWEWLVDGIPPVGAVGFRFIW